MSELKPYPEYKDSGLPWLGRIPTHWEFRRNSRIFTQRNEIGHLDLPILEVSLKTGVRKRNLENSDCKQAMSNRGKYKRAAKNDIVCSMMRMWQGALGVVPEDGLVSPAHVVARPFQETDSRFFRYLFRTAEYIIDLLVIDDAEVPVECIDLSDPEAILEDQETQKELTQKGD
jgi:type I restriction enzyme, S subunit